MADLKLDLTGDIVIEGGDAVLVDGVDAVIQQIKIRLKMFKGEWFQNPSEGMPWFQSILQKQPNTQSIAGIFRQAVQETPGVASVESLTTEFNAQERTLQVRFRARLLLDDVLVYEEFTIDA